MRTLLVDDLRVFRDARPATIARTSADALAALTREPRWDAVWLDHDLGNATGHDDTVMPFVDHLCERAATNDVIPIRVIYVHTSNLPGATTILRSLEKYGYTVRRTRAEDHFEIDQRLYDAAIARTNELPPTDTTR